MVGPGDLAALRLDADLVVLSGCRTAGGVLVEGEGVQGLTAPLIQAGARSVVASQWRIADRRTIPFIQAFYQALAKGLPVGDALRAAKLDGFRRGAPPWDWAAFTAVGDPWSPYALRAPWLDAWRSRCCWRRLRSPRRVSPTRKGGASQAAADRACIARRKKDLGTRAFSRTASSCRALLLAVASPEKSPPSGALRAAQTSAGLISARDPPRPNPWLDPWISPVESLLTHPILAGLESPCISSSSSRARKSRSAPSRNSPPPSGGTR